MGDKMKVHRHTLFITCFFILAIIIGTHAFYIVEGWSYLDSAYFLVITATTIGYGDIVPQTNLGKIITILYSFIGIASVLYLVSLINHSFFEKRLEKKIQAFRKRKKK